MQSGNTNLTWLVEQFVSGKLPDDLHEQLRQRLTIDPEFESRVLAQWMVHTYLEEQQNTTRFYQQIDRVATTKRKRQKPFLLLQLMDIVAVLVVCCVAVLRIYQYRQSPNGQVSTLVIVRESDDYGFAGETDSVRVVQYDRRWSFWDLTDSYTWRGDTLSLYSPELANLPVRVWQLRPTDRQDTYQLRTQQHTYELLRNQSIHVPLKADETP